MHRILFSMINLSGACMMFDLRRRAKPGVLLPDADDLKPA